MVGHTNAGPALEGLEGFQSKTGNAAGALTDWLCTQQVQGDGNRLSLCFDGIQAPQVDLHMR